MNCQTEISLKRQHTKSEQFEGLTQVWSL